MSSHRRPGEAELLPTLRTPLAALSTRTVRTWLDRLDRGGAGREGPELRAWPRHAYRPRRVPLDVLNEDGAAVEQRLVVGRNLSRTGAAVLTDRLLYPGRTCRLTLPGPEGQRVPTRARVVRCRYVVGSGTLYDIGLSFATPVDEMVLVPAARPIRLLVLDSDETLPDLIMRLLDDARVTVYGPDALAGDVAAFVRRCPTDLILLDLEDYSPRPLDLVAGLRADGYRGTILGLGVEIPESLYAALRAAGGDGYLRKPLTREALRSAVAAAGETPLVSSLAGDARLAPCIDEFVASLPDRARQLALALEVGDAELLNVLARDLRAEGGSYGFERITAAATELQTRIAVRDPEPALRRATEQLIRLCRRARPATPTDFVAPLGPTE